MVVKAVKLEIASRSKIFRDANNRSSWVFDAVTIATENNIITGYPDNTFRPKSNVTRAEELTIIVKVLNKK